MRNYIIIIGLFFSETAFGQIIDSSTPPPSVPLQHQKIEAMPEDIIHLKVDQKVKMTKNYYGNCLDFSIYGDVMPTGNNFKLSFISEIDGSLSKINLPDPIDEETKYELTRCLKSFSSKKFFDPAVLNGKKVRSLVNYRVVIDYEKLSFKFIEDNF